MKARAIREQSAGPGRGHDLLSSLCRFQASISRTNGITLLP